MPHAAQKIKRMPQEFGIGIGRISCIITGPLGRFVTDARMKFARKTVIRWLLLVFFAAVAATTAGAWWYAGYLSEPVLKPLNPDFAEQSPLPASTPGMKLEFFDVDGWDGTKIPVCIAVRDGEESPRQMTVTGDLGGDAAPPAADYVLVAVDWDHGIRSALPLAEVLTAAHYKCVLWEPRGRNNAREWCTHGLRESRDVPAIMNTLARRERGRELVIAAVGRGFGASMLMQAAAADARIGALVAIDVYKTLKEAVWNMLQEEAPPYLRYPAFWLLDRKLASTAGYECFDVAPIEAAPAIGKEAAVLLVNADGGGIATEEDALYLRAQLKSGVRDVWAPRGEEDDRDATVRMAELVIGKNKKGGKSVESIPVRLYDGEDALHLGLIRWLGEHATPVAPVGGIPDPLPAGPLAVPSHR